MHTIKVITGGLVLLALCLFIGRWLGGPPPVAGLTFGARLFIPLWLIAAGINLWVGVSKAGYSITDEAPVFVIVFAVPVAVALLALRLLARG